MKSFQFLAVTTLLLTSAVLADSAPGSMPISKKQIIKLSDKGLEPQTLKMTTDDSVLFFYNQSSDSLATLEIDFRGKTIHCASSNLKAAEDEFVRSIKPFGPKNFATTCFHEPGTYKYTVYGLKAAPAGTKGVVIVE